MEYLTDIVAGDDIYFDYKSPDEVDITDYTFKLVIKQTLYGQERVVVTNTPLDHTDAHNTTFFLSKDETIKLGPPDGWIEIRYCDGSGVTGSVRLGDKTGPQPIRIYPCLGSGVC
jgi:hypothetical protein